MTKTVILDYGLGNPASVKNILKKIGYSSSISAQAEDLVNADIIIIPGVGHFGKAMELLNKNNLTKVITDHAQKGKVVVGICLGMQLLCSHSEEGNVSGLNLIDADVIRFNNLPNELKIPNIGWRDVDVRDKLLLQGFPDSPRFYFTHSYYVKCKDDKNILMQSNYGFDYTVGIRNENVFGFQFHPEKSHAFGFHLLKNLYSNLDAS